MPKLSTNKGPNIGPCPTCPCPSLRHMLHPWLDNLHSAEICNEAFTVHDVLNSKHRRVELKQLTERKLSSAGLLHSKRGTASLFGMHKVFQSDVTEDTGERGLYTTFERK